MLLRIEDTDRERSSKKALESILSGMTWLGLDWEGEPVFQYERARRHQEIAEKLLASGYAYRCYASPEELNEMREKARARGLSPCYDGRWRDRDASEAPQGIKPVIRFKMPKEGETKLQDRVQGDVTWKNEALDDFIILRTDKTPTYMLAVVVDDHDMGVTHIIRGNDHFTNAARQIHLYRVLGWNLPTIAHIPLIHGPDNRKLSKRHGALSVNAYRNIGYLPEAVCNYLVRIGWSHGDSEIMSLQQMIEWFDLPSIGKAPGKFDLMKLQNLNGYYIRHSDDEKLVTAIESLLPRLSATSQIEAVPDTSRHAKLLAAMPELKERSKTLVELWEKAAFLFTTRPLTLESKAAEILTDHVKKILKALFPILQEDEEWSSASLESRIKKFACEENIKLSQIAQPLRVSLTGKLTSPGIFDVLTVLGKKESLNRISDQIES